MALSPAPGEAESFGLALVNTQLAHRGEPIDLLVDGPAAVSWLAARGLAYARPGPITAADLDRLGQLRAAIRAAFVARIDGGLLGAGSLQTLNTCAAAGLRPPRLCWGVDGPDLEWSMPPEGSGLDVALATIAADAIDIVSGPLGALLRACEAHGCVRLFLQDHGRRRWCSRTCGDRVRVARHYEKTRRERAD